MAKELKRTPLLEVEWCKLLGDARPDRFDPDKPDAWTIDTLLDNSNPEHVAFAEEIEAMYETLHPGKKKSANWTPVKPDKDQPRKRMRVKFKLPQFTFKDGNKSEGPVVFDQDGRRWPHDKKIGNGSKMRIGYDFYAWTSKNGSGSGISLNVRAAQVIEWLAAPESAKPTTANDFGFESTPEAEKENSAIPF